MNESLDSLESLYPPRMSPVLRVFLLFAVGFYAWALLGFPGWHRVSYGPPTVQQVDVTLAPGVGVEVVAVHASLKDMRLDAFDVDAQGMAVAVADGAVRDLASGARLSDKGVRIRDVILVAGNPVMVAEDNRLAIWNGEMLEILGTSPLSQSAFEPRTGSSVFMLRGKLSAGGYAIVELRPGHGVTVVCGSPEPVGAAARALNATWFSVGGTLFRLDKIGSPEYVLNLPEDSDSIKGLSELDGSIFFSTQDTVYALQGPAAIPLVLGLGGRLRASRLGLFVLDDRLGRLYRITGLNDLPKNAGTPGVLPNTPNAPRERKHVWNLDGRSASHIALVTVMMLYFLVAGSVARSTMEHLPYAGVVALSIPLILVENMPWRESLLVASLIIVPVLCLQWFLVPFFAFILTVPVRYGPRFIAGIFFLPGWLTQIGGLSSAMYFCNDAVTYFTRNFVGRNIQEPFPGVRDRMGVDLFLLLVSAVIAQLGNAILKHVEKVRKGSTTFKDNLCPVCQRSLGLNNRCTCGECGREIHRNRCSRQGNDEEWVCRTCEEARAASNEPELELAHQGEAKPGKSLCPVCHHYLGKRRHACSRCGREVHARRCTEKCADGERICTVCYEQLFEPSHDETDSRERADGGKAIESNESGCREVLDEELAIEPIARWGAAEELMATDLNRLFAACRALRGKRPEGYKHARTRLDAIHEELSQTPTRMALIVRRVEELSNDTFHWDP